MQVGKLGLFAYKTSIYLLPYGLVQWNECWWRLILALSGWCLCCLLLSFTHSSSLVMVFVFFTWFLGLSGVRDVEVVMLCTNNLLSSVAS